MRKLMIDANLTAAELSKRGIAAAKAGRNDEAREYLVAAVEADERNEVAWLWLGGLMPEVEDQIVCLENALHLNPNNAPAAAKLKKLYAKREPASPAPDPLPQVGRETAPASPFTAMRPANPFATIADTVAPANPFTASPIPAASPFVGNPPVPAVTQVMPDPPFGALPWDSFTATYGDSGNAANVPTDSAATSINPFSDNTSSVPRYQPGGHPEQRGNTIWEQQTSYHALEQPGTAPMYSYASEANPTEDYLASAIAGGQYLPPSQDSWSSQAGAGVASAFISDAPASGYADFNSSNRSGVGDADDAGYTAASYRDRYGDSAASFDIPELDHDERLDCPYCGWHTRLEDERCPNCEGELNLYVRKQDGRSSSLWFLTILWLLRALYSGVYVGISLVLLNYVKDVLAGSIDLGTTMKYGITSASLTKTAQGIFLLLAYLYGIQLVISLIMAIGSFLQIKIFYYINMVILGLTAAATILGFTLDPTKSVISLGISSVGLVLQFILLVRCEPDFLPQKQRIIEPSYHGEASSLGFFNLGTQYQKAGYTALAAKAWRRAVALSPGETRSRAALATAYNKMKRYDLAVQELQQAMKIDPNEPRFYNLMAITQMRMGDFTEARRYIAQAHELKPNNPDTLDTEKLIEDEAKKVAGKSKAASSPATSR